MRTKSQELCVILLLVGGGFLGASICAPNGFAQTQAEQQPSAGPKPTVSETVLVPKKTQPAPPVAPQAKAEKINPSDVYTLATSTNLVNVDVMVTDRDGNPIRNLGRKNFKLFDDGVPQTVSNFGTAEAPMTITMLIEFSNKWWGFLYLAVRHSYEFINFIHPKDWVAVVEFDMNPHILTDFTQDRHEVRSALDRLRIPGMSETNLYDALAFTIDRMKEIQGRKSILLIGTGCDTFSKATYDQALKIVRSSETVIYPISILEFLTVRYGDDIPCGPASGWGGATDSLQARNALNTIARYTGGQAYFPRHEGELPSIYQQISEQLRLQYSLGFVPTNPAKDGKFHKLKVELVDEQGNPLKLVNEKGKSLKYRVVARDGYYSPKS